MHDNLGAVLGQCPRKRRTHIGRRAGDHGDLPSQRLFLWPIGLNRIDGVWDVDHIHSW
ncbi:Uncharacterised protein [Mycobacteroides abscessus subsp. abscessus]|nr:Uncharacterised protein [Mycobacteroides abscessus subsp. abscessus]